MLEPPVGGDTLAAALTDADRPVLDGALTHGCRTALTAAGWPCRGALFTAALAARSAYCSATTPAVIAWAVRRGYLPAAAQGIAETVLCEALANAIVHGNLELPGLAAHGGACDAFLDAIAYRLDDDAFGLRPVVLTWRRAAGLLLLHVDDAGHGYPPPFPGGALPDWPVSGRGRTLMSAFARRVRVSRGGRRISLGFTHV
ncbi:MAG TPA: ATP-binding protein [Azospirillum sp.]